MKDDSDILATLLEAKEQGKYLLLHGQTQRGDMATMTLGRCFQSEPEVLLLGFEPEVAKSQIKSLLHLLAQTFSAPERIEDSKGESLFCTEFSLKDWFRSDVQVAHAVGLLTQAIPSERLTDFLALSQILLVTPTEN